MKKLLSVTLIIALILSICSLCAAGAQAASNYGISYPTKNEIINKIKELDIDISGYDSYSKSYSLDNFTLGEMDSKSQNKALALINLYRYIAGLSSDVTLNSEYSEYAQAASLINAANGKLSHYPDKPAGMSDELYEKAYYGDGRCNIASGFDSVRSATIYGWMDDSYANNIDRVGHRRWILNPEMKQTGFGSVESYSSMYSFDASREGNFTGDYVAWPAPNTPLDMFAGSVFSVNLGDDYDDPSIDNVRIELSSNAMGIKWVVTKSSGYDLYVNNENYGMSKCIIFKTVDFNEEDTISVKISGIYKDGRESPIQYTVNLFPLSEISAERTTILMKPYTVTDPGITASSMLMKETPYIDWDFDANGAAFITTEDLIYANKEGSCTITATILNCYSVTLEVIVKDSDFLLGDADGDDAIAISDVTMIQRFLAEFRVSSFCDYLSDTDGDGSIGISDATAIQRYLSGKSSPYDVGKSQAA